MNPSPGRRRILNLLVAIAMASGAVAVAMPRLAVAQTLEVERDLDVIRGMRKRHLFDLAETLCRRHLENRELTPTQTVDLTNELIQILAADAMVSDESQRDKRFQEADQVAESFLQSADDHPRRLLVAAQRALTHQLYGKLLVQERAAEMGDADHRAQALSQLRIASRMMQQVADEIDRLLPQQRARSLGPDDLSVEQLMNLKRNLQFQLAATDLIKAQLYAADDPLNRIDTLNQVIARLDDVLRQANDQQPLWWQAQLARIRARILLGQFPDAATQLRNLPVDAIPPTAHPEYAELWIEWANQSGNLDQASSFVQQVAKMNPVPPPLALAVLRWLAAKMSAAENETEQQRWLAQGTAWMKNIERQHGPYWGRRAELVLIGPSSNTPDGGNPVMSSDLELLVRVGDQAARQQRWKDAVRAYDKALGQARQSATGDQALVVAAKQAQALEALNRNAEAGALLTAVAKQFPQAATAPVAHLRGCWNLARELGTSVDAEQWAATLGEHLKLWPHAPSADRARRWLAAHWAQLGKDREALETTFSLSVDSPEWSSAYETAALAWQHRLSQSPDPAFAQRLLDRLRQQMQTSDDEPNAESRLVQQLLAAQIGLTSGQLDPESAQELLDQIATHATDEQLRWRREAEAWQVVALVAEGRVDQATTRLAESLPPDERLMSRVLNGLRTVLSPARWQSIGDVRQLVSSKALADPDVRDPVSWKLVQAQALMDQGQHSAAVELLETLAQSNPRSLAIRLALARALTAIDAASPEALAEWRRIAAMVKPRGRAWYEARLNTARILVAQGQRDQALKLLRYLKTVPPGWTDAPFEAEFESLLKQLQDQ